MRIIAKENGCVLKTSIAVLAVSPASWIGPFGIPIHLNDIGHL
jgi:hypothetical protein